jgi:hypothetical protein
VSACRILNATVASIVALATLSGCSTYNCSETECSTSIGSDKSVTLPPLGITIYYGGMKEQFGYLRLNENEVMRCVEGESRTIGDVTIKCTTNKRVGYWTVSRFMGI